MARAEDFAALIHQILVMERRGTVEETAKALGMKYHTFYMRVNGRVPFSADEIRDLVHQVGDIRLLTYFTEGTRFFVAERGPHEGGSGDGDVKSGLLRGAHDTVVEAADILEETARALDDEKLDHHDIRRIREEVDQCERALAGLRRLLDSRAPLSPAE